MPQTNIRLGAAYAIGSAALFASMAVLVKLTHGQLTNEQAVFIRSLVALSVIGPWLLIRHGTVGLRTHRPWDHFIRAFIGVVTMYGFFYAIRNLPLATAMLLNYSTPLYLPFISLLWLNERPGFWVYPGAAIGIAGVACVLNPGANGWVSFPALIGALSGFGAALAMASVRRMTDTEPTTRIVFFFSLLATLMSALPLPWRWLDPSPQMWLVMIAAGLLAAFGQLALTKAYSYAPAAQIGPVIYTSVIFSALWGWAIWDDVLSGRFILGTVLIVLGSALALRSSPPDEAPGADELLPEELIREDLVHGRTED